MPDDFTITLAANVGEFMSGMDSAASSASKAAEEIKGSFTDSGIEGWFTNLKSVVDNSMAGIEARFEASGAVIRDYANEIKNEGFIEASAAERTVALNQEVQSEREATFAKMRDEFNGTADAQRAQAAQMEEAAQREAAALKEVEAQAEASTMTFGKMKTAFWDLWTAMFAVDMIVGVFKGMADDVMKLGDSIRMTSVELGVGNNQARAFNETMDSLGVSSTTVSSAMRKLMMDVSNGGKELARLKDATGAVITENRTGLDIFEQVVTKINNISDSTQKAEAAYQLLGQGGMHLLGVLQEIPGRLEAANEAQSKNTAANDAAVQQSLALHEALTELKSAWDDDVINIAPAIVGALNAISFAVKQIGDDSQAAVRGLQDFAAAVENAVKAAADWANKAVVSLMNPTEKDPLNIHSGHPDAVAGDMSGYSPDAEASPGGGGSWQPKPGPKGRKGGAGGADPIAGVDDALISSQNQMDKMAAEYQKLSSEAQMSSKASAESFDTLQARAVADYQTMTDAHTAFANAVQSGDAEAAKASEKDWHDAAQKFQQDWEAARQKAVQDMKEIKSTADTMAGEVSGVLNSALSGNLNWASEINKIGGQMISELTKYLFQMVALMINHQTMMAAAQQAGQGNMVGSLINWLAQKIGLEATNNAASLGQHVATETGKATASVTAQATQLSTLAASLAAQIAAQKGAAVVQGTTDAGVAAANTMASLSGIPIVGPALAAATAPVMFSETLAYAVAEGGFDVPAGIAPMAQLHPREMVLPASLADNIRNMNGGSGGSTSVTQNIHAIDSKSFLDIVDSNHQGIAQAVAKARRAGGQFNIG